VLPWGRPAGLPDSGYAGVRDLGADGLEGTQGCDNERVAFWKAASRHALLNWQLLPDVGRAGSLSEPSSTESLYTFAMAFRFRSALMWLLLLALPLQGFAAATMINCGPNHHRMMASSGAEPTETHEHLSGGERHHEMGMAADHDHDEAASAEVSGEGLSLPHLDKLMKFKCNACAVCCMGAAMPTAAFTFEPPPPAIAPEFFVPSSHVGFVTDGPDRPPRLSHL